MQRLFLASLCASLLGTTLRVQAQDHLPVSTAHKLGHLGEHLTILEDPSGNMDLRSAASSEGFIKPDKAVPNLQISPSAFWIKLPLFNDTDENSVYLDLAHPEVEEIDAYLIANGKVEHIGRTGQSQPVSERPIADPDYVFPMPLRIGQRGMVYMRVKSNKQLQVPITVHSPSRFSQSRVGKNLIFGCYVGILAVMALYNFFVFISIRDRSYLIYVIYILSVCLTQLTFTGLGQFYLWPDSTWFATKASIIFTFITAVSAGEFMKTFIDTRTHAPRAHKGIKYFYSLFALVMVLYLFVQPLVGYALAQLSAGLFATYMFITIYKVWRKGSRQAGYFLIAWSVFLIGTLVFVLKDMGLMPYNDITLYTMPVGSAIEGVLLSFGLADRINVLRREKERSQANELRTSQENERIIREQNSILEDRVQERTQALLRSNEDLKLTQTKLVNAEKMASLGQLTAGIAHEINNPINFITSNIAPLRRNIKEIVEVMEAYRSADPSNATDRLLAIKAQEEQLGIQDSIDELDDIIGSIAEGSSRTAEIVRGLRNFSRLDEDDLKDSDLNEGMRSTLAVLGPGHWDKVTLKMELGDIPTIECYPGKVNQVFMNILTNAVQATMARTDGRPRDVLIRTSVVEDHVQVSVKDNGIGMTKEVMERIYDPFFTTKDVGEGTGLGLSIVFGIIEDHHGTISVESEPGVGSEFRILLPIRQQRATEKRA